MKHTMEVDPEVWEWGQRISGLKNAAPCLRARLRADREQYMAQERAAGELLIPPGLKGPNQRGRVVTATQYTTTCNHCWRIIKAGSEAVLYRGARAAEMYHPDCWDHMMGESE